MRKILLGFVALCACGLTAMAQAADRIPVVASFSILGDIVSNVGGDRVAVQSLVGPDQDPHVFEPAPADVAKVEHARLLVLNGLGLEGWMARLSKSSGYKGMVLVASKGMHARTMPAEDGNGRETDPHAWQDPTNVILYVKNIAAALTRLDPAGATVYRANAANYTAELKALDTWARQEYAKIPKAKRRVITSHDAFGYHGRHYGIEFLAPQGVSTESEASAKDVAALIKQMKAEHIKAVFMENMSNPKLIEQMAKDTGVSMAGKLYPDALSKADGPAPTYLKLLRFNVTQISTAMMKN